MLKPSRIWRSALLAVALTPWIGSPAAAGTLLIENVTLIDGTGRPAVQESYALVEGERITRVGRGTFSGPTPERRIDGAGKYLMPGLTDMPIHIRGAARFYCR